MTLFLVFSDTHGDLTLAGQVIARFPQANGIIHLGDVVRDAARLAARHPDLPVYAVAGNCDFGADPQLYPAERELLVEGKRLLLTHGHRFGVKDGYRRIAARCNAGRYDCVLFGHTHIAADVVVDGAHLLNPGSLSRPKGVEGPSYALLEIGHGMLETRLMESQD
jgi:putative phosphoesterase